MNVESVTLTREDLDLFRGSERAYPAPGGGIYTDGVRHVIEAGEAWWLIVDIAVYSKRADVVEKCGGYQFWRLTTRTDPEGVKSTTLTCVPDEGESPVFSHEYWVTDVGSKQIRSAHEAVFLAEPPRVSGRRAYDLGEVVRVARYFGVEVSDKPSNMDRGDQG